jgi:hypothetical protein
LEETMSSFVWAKGDAVVQIGKVRAVIKRGECRHAWDHVVVSRPELFSSSPTLVVRAVGDPPPEVEQATAGPGEKRSTRRAS